MACLFFICFCELDYTLSTEKMVNGLGYIFKTLRAVLFASANCSAHKVRRDSCIAAQGVQPLVRNAVTQNSPDFNRPGCLPRRAHNTGLAPV